MPSIQAILSGLSLSSLAYQSTTPPQISLQPPSIFRYEGSSTPPSCPNSGPLSCHPTTSPVDTCCYLHPGGQLLLTQFWDTSPSIGPVDSWTLHGLWPDLCDGRYESFCSYAAPRYANITDILLRHNQTELLATMLKYWLPNRGTPESFWAHEWNKHGTCVSTLAPRCYTSSYPSNSNSNSNSDEGGYTSGQELIDYFSRATTLFHQLPTHPTLVSAGITPSTSRTYTHAEISAALFNVTGAPVILGCNRGALNEVWYTFNVRGNLQTGAFVGTVPAGTGKGTCPEKGIRWLPKE